MSAITLYLYCFPSVLWNLPQIGHVYYYLKYRSQPEFVDLKSTKFWRVICWKWVKNMWTSGLGKLEDDEKEACILVSAYVNSATMERFR